MRSRKFWIEATERAVKSAAQAVIGLIVIDTTNAVDALNTDWGTAGSFALGAAILSYLTSMVTSGVGEPNDPSAV